MLKKTNEQLERTVKELEDKLNMLGRESSLKNGEFDSMVQLYERQLAERNTEIAVLKDRLGQLQKKIELLGLELAGLKDANDKNQS
jgi:predicted RNase H-like nuclease (RuvC/YqgF family)